MNKDSLQKYIFLPEPYFIQNPLCVFLSNILKKKRLGFVKNKYGINPSNFVYFYFFKCFSFSLVFTTVSFVEAGPLVSSSKDKKIFS